MTYILEDILREMNSNYPVATSRECSRFTIVSETIYSDIIRRGGKERKSLNVKFPNIPKKYLPDFVRGLWDGDGCIYYSKQNKSYAASYTSASYGFITELYCALKKNIPNLAGCLHKYDNEYSLRFSKNDTIRLKKFMYQGLMTGKLMLKRKYELFLKTPDDYARRSCHVFLNYNDSKNIIMSFNFKSQREWRRYCKAGKRPNNIPRHPNKTYKDKGKQLLINNLQKPTKYYKIVEDF